MSTPEQLINLLEDTASILQKTQINLKKCPKHRLTPSYLENRIKCIDEYWSTFSQTHQNLAKLLPREKRSELPYFVNEDYFLYEDLYLNMRSELNEILSKNSPSHTNTSQDSSSSMQDLKITQVKLPRITLPTFTGKYEEWPTFQDLFNSLVHENTQISNVQKLHYLKSSIAGEAENLLRQIQITENNYIQAWNILKHRYGNKRIIVTSILRRLFTQKKINNLSSHHIKSLLDVTTECLHNLKNLQINIDSWDPLIIFLVIQKLDPESHKDWEQFSFKENSEELPSWNDLTRFLETKFRTLELLTSAPVTTIPKQQDKSRTLHATLEKTCIICQGDHTLCHCKKFTSLSPTERSAYVKTKCLCYNCLLPGHSVKKCRLQMSCRICHKRHHSLLHEQTFGQSSNSTQPKVSAYANVEEPEEEIHAMMTSHFNEKQSTAILATAVVTVRSVQGTTITMRALIDQGSEASFVTEKAAQLLKLARQPARGCVVGMGSTKTPIKSKVKLMVYPRWESDYCLHIEAYVISKELTTKLPHNTMAVGDWQHIKDLKLADPNYFKPGSIDLLLGVKEYASILREGLIKGTPHTAQKILI